MKIRNLGFLFVAGCAAPLLSFADDGPNQSPNQSQWTLGAGGQLLSSTLSSPAGDVDSGGFGLALKGAGHGSRGDGKLAFAALGQFGIDSRKVDDTNETAYDRFFDVDVGTLVSDRYLVTLGFTLHAIDAEDAGDHKYGIVPLGLGMMWSKEHGYALVQMRFGGGVGPKTATNPDGDMGYFGLRGVWPIGRGYVGAQLDQYSPDKGNAGKDRYFRIDFGFNFIGA